jgi:hypothetical protein
MQDKHGVHIIGYIAMMRHRVREWLFHCFLFYVEKIFGMLSIRQAWGCFPAASSSR